MPRVPVRHPVSPVLRPQRLRPTRRRSRFGHHRLSRRQPVRARPPGPPRGSLAEPSPAPRPPGPGQRVPRAPPSPDPLPGPPQRAVRFLALPVRRQPRHWSRARPPASPGALHRRHKRAIYARSSNSLRCVRWAQSIHPAADSVRRKTDIQSQSSITSNPLEPHAAPLYNLQEGILQAASTRSGCQKAGNVLVQSRNATLWSQIATDGV